MTQHESTATVLRKNKKVLIASLTGSSIEWFDYFLYGTAAALVFNKIFFPMVDPVIGLILSYLSFSLTFFIRPIGGVLFAHIGDRIGRKKTLVLTLSLMGGATVMIGLLPTYDMIGMCAPALLILMRIIQGMGIGGEWGGALLLAYEYAPEKRKGFFGSIPQAGVTIGMLMATFIVSLMTLFSEEDFLSWGWRIPFFLALPMGAVALWLRVSMEETPSFVQQREKPVVTQASTAATFKTILMGIGRVMVWSAAGYTYLVIMPTYLQSALHTGFNQALLIAVISNIGFAFTIIPSGMLSDRIGRRTVMIIATVLLLILALPLLKILQAESSTLAVKAIVVLIAGGLVGMLAGPGPAMLSEMFPTRVRYTGLGLAYSLSNAIFSGCAGLIITGLIKETGNLDIPAYYVMATAVVSIFALMTLRKDDHLRSLEE
ncbi:MFS transporter [Enterobacter sp. TUM13743]|nr:MFS transporter [Enterobacter sp. TUM13743]